MTIQEWLSSSRDYETGRLLYERFGPNSFLKRTLSSGPNGYNISALTDELTKLARLPQFARAAVPVALPAPPAPEPPKPTTKAAVKVGLGKAILPELGLRLKSLYDRRSLLRATIAHKANQEVRKRDAFEILDLTDRVEELLATIAHVEQHGQLPVERPAPDFTDPMIIRKRIGTLRANISKNKDKHLKAATVAAWEQEKQSLQAKLKDATTR